MNISIDLNGALSNGKEYRLGYEVLVPLIQTNNLENPSAVVDSIEDH